MGNNKASLSVDVKDIVMVKPSKPTPSGTLSLSSMDNDPTLDLLQETIYAYQANLDNPNGQLDPVCVIKEGLSKALVYYYPFAGKIITKNDGKLGINCNADGVPLLEANADSKLSSLHYLEGIDVPTLHKLVFDKDETSYHPYPLVFQVTKFLCGGFTIAMGISHVIVDGFGASQFFKAMTELASGKSEPSVKPVWERERLVGTVLKEPLQLFEDEASVAVSPFWPTTDISHECFSVKGKSIQRLKMKLMAESDDNVKESFTTFETLGAYVWRSRARAMELSSDGITSFCFAVGLRHLLDPPLPKGYYGNAFVCSDVVLTVKELNEKPLSEVVKLIKECKKLHSNAEYIRNLINKSETLRKQNKRIGGTGACLDVTDWRQLGLLEEVDFGWKASVNLLPVPLKIGHVDLCIFAPPSSFDPLMKGGVRVFVSLPKASMPKFREEMEALNITTRDDEGITQLEK